MKHTQETKDKLRLLQLGRKHTPETKEKMSVARRRRTLTLETKEKIGLAHRGRVRSLEVKEKMSVIRSSLGPQHQCASRRVFKSPTNVVWDVKNVCHFVRSHPELFPPSDTAKTNKKRKNYNKAVGGLLSLCKTSHRRRGSWKGWVLVSRE
jgi:hypothetical protein